MNNIKVTFTNPSSTVDKLRPIVDTFMQKLGKDRDLPDVCMIFISERDFLRRGNVIYHIDRVLRETGEVIDNGYQEIYVNAEIDDGSDLAEYMKIFKSNVVCSNTKFPIICDLTDYYKNGKGRDAMCQAVEEYAKECGELNRREGRLEGRMEGELKGRILTYTELGFSINDISEKMKLSVDEVQEVLDDAIL